MAQYVHQYVQELLKREVMLANTVGTNVMGTGAEAYRIHLLTLVMVGTIMKTVSEALPVITDAIWLDRLDHALDGTWPDWILAQDTTFGLGGGNSARVAK